MAVRHPLDRIVSAWSFFCNAPTDQEIKGQHDVTSLGYYWGMPFALFLDLCLEKHSKNAHTRAQVEFAGPHHIDVLCPLERLQEAWEVLRGLFQYLHPLTVSHQSQRTNWQTYYTPSQRNRAEQVFANDMRMFEQAQGTIQTFINTQEHAHGQNYSTQSQA